MLKGGDRIPKNDRSVGVNKGFGTHKDTFCEQRKDRRSINRRLRHDSRTGGCLDDETCTLRVLEPREESDVGFKS